MAKKKTTKSSTECNRCGGSGRISFHSGSVLSHSSPTHARCPYCDGFGFLRDKKETKIAKKKRSKGTRNKQWKTVRGADGSWSIFDEKGEERFRGRNEETLIVYLAENMKELDKARKRIEELELMENNIDSGELI